MHKRIYQVLKLLDNKHSIERELLDQFKGPKRRNVRKAINSGVTVKEDDSKKARKILFKTHTTNIKNLNGNPKPAHFF